MRAIWYPWRRRRLATETYAALRLDIDNWRWSGVPFFIRTGERLPVTRTELPRCLQAAAAAWLQLHGNRRPEPGQLVVKLDPSTGIRLRVEARRADSPIPETIHLDMEFAEEGGEGPTPYEVLLTAAMVGQIMRFTRGRGRRDLADYAAAAGRAAPGTPVCAQGRGGRGLLSG